ncbi:MAG: hypothetical protein IJ400_03305 [Clostridia bacterium]|nr:hypothetical protein [Clostridia bacterium]
MKKSLLVALLAILCLTLVLSFTACGGGGNEGGGECVEHSYGEWTLVKSATCDTKGSEKRACTVCQAEDTRETDELGHDWNDWNTVTELTCTVDGKQTRSCKNCTETEDKTLVHLGHNPVDIVPSKAPSAIEDGNSAGSKCSECGEVFEESLVYHKYENVASKAEWSVTNGNANFWAIDWNRLLDGDIRTGTNSPKGKNLFIYMDYENPMYLDDFIITCNGYGKYKPGAGETTENTYNISKLKIVLYSIEKIDETTGEPLYKEEFATDVIDTSSLLEVNIADYGYTGTKLISRIGINIQDGPLTDKGHPGDNGTYYLYEVTVNGSTLITVCDNQGCDWSEWTVTKEAECTKEALINGVETRTCSRCGKEETKTIVASHNWDEYEIYEEPACGLDGSKGRYCLDCDKADELVTVPMPYDHNFGEWYGENYNCTTGGTMTRTCQNEGCGFTEEKFAEPGQHVNVTVEGYVAPTTEADGATGKATCDSCGTIIYENRVISKITNALTGATITSPSTHWHVTGQDEDKSGLLAAIDGNKERGSASDPSKVECQLDITLAEATTDLTKVILTVNGKGSLPGWYASVEETTNLQYEIWFVVYNEAGEEIFKSDTYNTLDKIDIEVDVNLAEGQSAKKISVIRKYPQYSNQYNLWEVQALGGGKIVEE